VSKKQLDRTQIFGPAVDAKCGFACHTIVKTRDYVFTEYGKR